MLENHRTVNHYGIQLDETINILLRICGGKPPQPAFNTDELDPAFDYDFNSVEDDGRRYMRGGFKTSDIMVGRELPSKSWQI